MIRDYCGRAGVPFQDASLKPLANGIGHDSTHFGASTVDAAQARAIARGLAEAGIRPSYKHRQIGDYRLARQIAEGEDFQDFEACHVSMATVHRRVRIYTVATGVRHQRL